MIYIILVLCGVAGACIILRSRYEVKHFKVKEYNFVTDKITIDTTIPVALKLIQGTVPNYYLNGLQNSPAITLPIS